MKYRLKILVIEPSGNLWGSEKVLLNFLSVASQKADFAVCYPYGSLLSKNIQSLPVASYPWFIANLHKKYFGCKLLSLLGLFSSVIIFRPDIIYINQAGVTRLVKLISKIFSIPVLIHVRLMDDVSLVEGIVSKSTFICELVCISDYLVALFGKKRIVKNEKLHMLYDAYEPKVDWKKTPLSNPVKKNRTISFSCVGRLDPSKGQDILLRAISILKREGILVNVVFVGKAGTYSKTYADDLISLSEELEIQDRVTWAGYQSDVHSIIKDNLALICPSSREALGRVVFEAWDAGRIPLVWQGAGGCAEVVKASGGGVLYEEQNGESLASAIKLILDYSDKKHHELVKKGRDWLEANCKPSTYTDNMLKICERLVKKK